MPPLRVEGNLTKHTVISLCLKLEALTSTVIFHTMGLILEVELKAMINRGFRQGTK